MFSDSPFVFRFRTVGRRAVQGGSWLVLAPGLALTLMALAILIWPQLLAYMVASVLLFAGLSLTVWGWTIRRAERQRGARTVTYEVL
jgi:uncharacterized membrane protein YqjE